MKQGEILYERYEIIKKVGVGGMSTVYMAKDLKTGEYLALKDIDKTSKEYRAVAKEDGTLDEIEIVKSLKHPYIPYVIDVKDEKDSLRVIMEYVQGKDLKTVSEKYSPLEEALVIDIALKLCHILIYLHTRENPVIYRDLKPGNIMLKKDGEIRLLDFGIAVYKGSEYKLFGTRQFASPEHFKGNVDERSDLYCLGTTIYSLLAGSVPHANDFVLPPVRSIRPDVSKELEKIIIKASNPEPKKRYQKASDIMKDLLKCKNRKKQKRKLRFVSIFILALVILAAILVKLFIY